MATKQNADTIIGSVRHKGETYGAGDEEALAAAGLPKSDLQRLANKGVITGFGTSAKSDAGTEDEDAPPAKQSAGTAPAKTPDAPAKGGKPAKAKK